jgi:hypothetical protein
LAEIILSNFALQISTMKAFYFFLLAIAFALTTATFANWQVYTDPDATFSIEFPAFPKLAANNMMTDSGTISIQYATYDAIDAANENNLRYLVSCTALPKDVASVTSTDSLDIILDNAVQGSLRNHGATLVSSNKITFAGNRGIEVLMTMKDEAVFIKMRQYIINGRHVGLMVYTLKAKTGNSDANRFFDSFKLVK